MKYAIENIRGDFWTGSRWGDRAEARLYEAHFRNLPEFIDDLDSEFELMLYVHNSHPFKVGEIDAKYYEPLNKRGHEDPIATVIVIREGSK